MLGHREVVDVLFGAALVVADGLAGDGVGYGDLVDGVAVLRGDLDIDGVAVVELGLLIPVAVIGHDRAVPGGVIGLDIERVGELRGYDGILGDLEAVAVAGEGDAGAVELEGFEVVAVSGSRIHLDPVAVLKGRGVFAVADIKLYLTVQRGPHSDAVGALLYQGVYRYVPIRHGEGVLRISGAAAGYRLQINTGAVGNASDLLAAAQAYGDGDGLSLIGLTGVGGNVSTGLGDAGHVGDRGGNVVQLIGLNNKVDAAAVKKISRGNAVAAGNPAGAGSGGHDVAVEGCHCDGNLGTNRG